MGNTASDKKNARTYSLKFSRNTDPDIIEQLDSQNSIQGYIKSLIRADIKKGEAKMKVQFEAGISRHSSECVNYLICLEDEQLYAETVVPDNASDDYGYLALKQEIIRQATEAGINPDSLEFWYDGQEDKLEPDAKADCLVSK